jgi:hypothetical protein
MISLPVANYPVVKDDTDDCGIDQNDINVTFTYAEHELLVDVLAHAAEAIDFACPWGQFDLPMDSEFIQRCAMIQNLRERFNTAWDDRFNSKNDNEIH